MTSEFNRRQIVRAASGLVTAGGVALIAPSLAIAQAKEKQEEKMEDVTPPEDLMREHGVLNRILLIYEAAMQKFAGNKSSIPPSSPNRPRSYAISSRTITRSTSKLMYFPVSRKQGSWLNSSTCFSGSTWRGAGSQQQSCVLHRQAPRRAGSARKRSRPCKLSSGCAGRKTVRIQCYFRRLEAS